MRVPRPLWSPSLLPFTSSVLSRPSWSFSVLRLSTLLLLVLVGETYAYCPITSNIQLAGTQHCDLDQGSYSYNSLAIRDSGIPLLSYAPLPLQLCCIHTIKPYIVILRYTTQYNFQHMMYPCSTLAIHTQHTHTP